MPIDSSLPWQRRFVNRAPNRILPRQRAHYVSLMSLRRIRARPSAGSAHARCLPIGRGHFVRHRIPRPAQEADCRSSPRRSIVVVAATTDVHGRSDRLGLLRRHSGPESRPVARGHHRRFAAHVANPDRVVLVDAGDMLQGNPLTFVAARIDTTHPNPAIAAMNVDRATTRRLSETMTSVTAWARWAARSRRLPFRCSPPTPTRERSRVPIPRTSSSRRGGVRIGIVGATHTGRDGLGARQPPRPGGLRDIVPEVRTRGCRGAAKGADVIVVVLHARDCPAARLRHRRGPGVASENVAARVAREVSGIDLIVFGHSHRELGRHRDQRHATAPAEELGDERRCRASRTVERTSGANWRVARSRATTIQAAGRASRPAVVCGGCASARGDGRLRESRRSEPRRVGLARGLARAVRDTPLIDFILEVERRGGSADLASTARRSRSMPRSTPAHDHPSGALARLYPYDNTLRAIRSLRASAALTISSSAPATSARLRRPGPHDIARERARARIQLRHRCGRGLRASTFRVRRGRAWWRCHVDGKPVADTDTFTDGSSTTIGRRGGGGYAMLRGAPIVYDRQQEIRRAPDRRGRASEDADAGDLLQAETGVWRPRRPSMSAYLAMHANPAEHAGGPVRPIGPGVAAAFRDRTRRRLPIPLRDARCGSSRPTTFTAPSSRGRTAPALGAAARRTWRRVIARARAECAAGHALCEAC